MNTAWFIALGTKRTTPHPSPKGANMPEYEWRLGYISGISPPECQQLGFRDERVTEILIEKTRGSTVYPTAEALHEFIVKLCHYEYWFAGYTMIGFSDREFPG